MKPVNKHFGLVLATIAAAFSAVPAFALLTSATDELYSETIYIEKSSAEVPGALESNAKSSEDATVVAANDAPAETVADAETAPVAPKKASKKRKSHK